MLERREFGTVRFFDNEKGWGFLESEGKDYFVHYSDVEIDGYKSLKEAQQVSFLVDTSGEKGLKAVSVQLVED